MTDTKKHLDEILNNLIARQTILVREFAKSETTGTPGNENLKKALDELNDMHKKAADDIAATKAKNDNMFNSEAREAFLKFAEELLRSGTITGTIAGPAGASLRKALVPHKSVIVETNGNRDANMALASLFAKDEDLDEIVARASFFAILFFGTTRRILWDDEKAHAAAVKDISESCKGIRKVTVGEAVRILKSTSPEPIDKNRLDISDTFFKLHCLGLKAKMLQQKALDLKNGGSSENPKEQTGSTMVKISWTPYIGEPILHRQSSQSSWFDGRFCGVSKKHAYIENGVPVEEIAPAHLVHVFGKSRIPVFRVNNRRLIQVA